MRSSIICVLCLVAAVPAFAQHGGKAEPKRLEIAHGKTVTTATGTLSNDQESDLVFAARAGQKIRLSVTSLPAGRLFDLHIQGDGFDLPTEFDRYTSYSFIAPETGDYLVFVRKRPTRTVQKAKFTLRLTIK